MAVLETREVGIQTKGITLRLRPEAHNKLREYALQKRKSMVLAAEELILKGTEHIDLAAIEKAE